MTIVRVSFFFKITPSDLLILTHCFICLENLESFRSVENSCDVLVATDIAARGLDVPAVGKFVNKSIFILKFLSYSLNIY